jgi:hypothetical protein
MIRVHVSFLPSAVDIEKKLRHLLDGAITEPTLHLDPPFGTQCQRRGWLFELPSYILRNAVWVEQSPVVVNNGIPDPRVGYEIVS